MVPDHAAARAPASGGPSVRRLAGCPVSASSATPLDVRDLGRVAYAEAWALQAQLVDARHAGEVGDTLLLCEHEGVVTTGRGTQPGFLRDERFPVVEVERGGEATWHGPGQLVAYPIVRLARGRRDLHAWLRALEQAVMDALAAHGLVTARRPGATGVWTADGARKLCSLGVAARRWVSWHGLALNVDPDLSAFEAIQPCGFDAAVMTSVAAEQGADAPGFAALRASLTEQLVEQLEPFRETPPGGTP